MPGEMSEESPRVLSSGGQLLGREREREVLDRLLDGVGVAACWWCMAKRAWQDRAARVRGRGCARVSDRPDVRDRRRDGAPVRSGSAAVFPVPRADGPSTAAAARGAWCRVRTDCGSPRRIRSWSDWRSSACWPRPPRSSRSCVSSMTRSGSIVRLRGPWHLWRAVSWRRRSRSCSRTSSSATRSRACRISSLRPWAS